MRFQCNNCMSVVAIEDSEMGQPVACGNCSKVVVVPSGRLDSGSVIGDFVVERPLGEGGLASVYLAHQLSLDRPAALKILHDRFAKDANFIKSFVQEARAAAQLNHPNIVQAYAVGEEEGVCYFAMEYVQGNTLKTVISHSGRFVAEHALRIVQEICAALDFAWNNKRLVHRDIKPDNIIITAKRQVKLADLGLARVRDDIMEDHSGEIFGTPQYVAPEQLLGYTADNRSDIYSLGATLFHLITGQCPYSGQTPAETARKHISEVLPSPKSIVDDLPEPICQLIRVMMAKRPGHRYQSAAELLSDIALVQNGEFPERRPLKEYEIPIDLERVEEEMAAVVTPEQEQEEESFKKRQMIFRQVQGLRVRGGEAGTEKQPSRKKLKLSKTSSSGSTQANSGGTQSSVSKTAAASAEESSEQAPPLTEGGDGSSRRRLKFSGGSSNRFAANASSRRVHQSRRARKRKAKDSDGAKSRRWIILIVLPLFLLAAVGAGGYYYFQQRGPVVEPRFGMSPEQTLQFNELENDVAEMPRGQALSALRAAVQEYSDYPEAVEHLRTLAAPRLEAQARELRAEQWDQELERWRGRSRQLIAQEQERQARLEEQARQDALAAEREERERIERELRQRRRERLEREQERLRRETVRRSRQNNFAQARIEYAVMASSEEADFRDWAGNQIAMLAKAEQALNTFRGTGDALQGMRFVAPGQIRPGQIVSIDRVMISAEIIEPVYRAGELVGERRQPITVSIDSLEPRRVVSLIDSAWHHREGADSDQSERDLMVGAYLLSRGEMLDTAEQRLRNAGGSLARAWLEELPRVREVIVDLR